MFRKEPSKIPWGQLDIVVLTLNDESLISFFALLFQVLNMLLNQPVYLQQLINVNHIYKLVFRKVTVQVVLISSYKTSALKSLQKICFLSFLMDMLFSILVKYAISDCFRP
jgi:hypothetical protein